MDTGTKHVIGLLRSLADEIEHGRAVYFDVKTDAGTRDGYDGYPRGLTDEERAFQRFEIKAEINPNAPKRCPECRSALVLGDKCVTVECPVGAEDPAPFMWYIDGNGAARHALPCDGVLELVDHGSKRCTKCQAVSE